MLLKNSNPSFMTHPGESSHLLENGKFRIKNLFKK